MGILKNFIYPAAEHLIGAMLFVLIDSPVICQIDFTRVWIETEPFIFAAAKIQIFMVFNKVVCVEIVKAFSCAFENIMANGRRHLCPFEGKDWADLMELTNEQEYCQPTRTWGKD